MAEMAIKISSNLSCFGCLGWVKRKRGECAWKKSKSTQKEAKKKDKNWKGQTFQGVENLKKKKTTLSIRLSFRPRTRIRPTTTTTTSPLGPRSSRSLSLPPPLKWEREEEERERNRLEPDFRLDSTPCPSFFLILFSSSLPSSPSRGEQIHAQTRKLMRILKVLRILIHVLQLKLSVLKIFFKKEENFCFAHFWTNFCAY